MNYNSFPLNVPSKTLEIPSLLRDGRNICLCVISENTGFRECLKVLNINKSFVSRIFSPSYNVPFKYEPNNIVRDSIKSLGYKPIFGYINDSFNIQDMNLIVDLDNPFKNFLSRYNFSNYDNKNANHMFFYIINQMKYISSKTYEKSLIYNIDCKNVGVREISKRMVYVLFKLLYGIERGEINRNIIDTIFLHLTNSKQGNIYIKIYDLNKSIEIGKILNYINNFSYNYNGKNKESLEEVTIMET